VYRNGGLRDIGTLPGGFFSWAIAINDADQVVGYASSFQGSFVHAILYADGIMPDLGTLGGNNSYGRAINSAGDLVGASLLPDNRNSHAFIYTGGVMLDLNDLIDKSSGWTLVGATAINDSGQIVGSGLNHLEQHA